MKNTSGFVLRKAQARITQQIYGGAILLLAGLMWFNSQNFTFAGDNNVISTNLNIKSGTLELVNVGTSLKFADITAGVGGTSLNDLSNTVVRDFRGSGNQYWSIRVNSSNMNSAGDANSIHAYNVQIWPGNATISNLDGGTMGGSVGKGEGNAVTLNILRNIFNSTYNASGAIIINGLRFGVTAPATLPAGVYSGGILMSVLATDGT